MFEGRTWGGLTRRFPGACLLVPNEMSLDAHRMLHVCLWIRPICVVLVMTEVLQSFAGGVFGISVEIAQ